MAVQATMPQRISRWVVIVSSAWFAFTAFWGLGGISGSGHLGAGSAGNVMAAEQIVRWHIWYPAWDWYQPKPPTVPNYICHHPFGQYYVPAFFLWILGHHDYVVHLPAAILSALVPPLLYGIAKEHWGHAAGAVAAASYVVVPITVGFSTFTNLETFCIFGALAFFWGHTRHMATGKRRYLVVSLVGLWFSCAGDWAGYLLVAPMLVWCFLRAFLLPARLTPRIHFDRYAKWWGLSIGMVAGTLLFWLALFAKADQIGQWVMAATGRTGSEGTKLKEVLESRKIWIDFSFTPLAIKLGKWAFPVALVRLLWTRLDEEAYSLSLLFGAVVQYVVFKQGADVHIFWPIYFAPYFSLALAQMVHAIGASTGWLAGRFLPGRRAMIAAWTVLALGLVAPLRMAYDGVASLWVWRRTGGRYDDKGSYIRSNIDQLDVTEQVLMPQTARGTTMDVNGTAGWGWEQQWKWAGMLSEVGMPLAGSRAAASHPFWTGRGSNMMGDIERKIAAAGHVRIYEDQWIIDQREPPGLVDAYAVEEREPNFFEWLWYGGTEPRRLVGKQPDPWLTWEWRTHLGQPAFPPTGNPVTLDQLRIAHNVAVSQGDTAGAERWREKIEAAIDRGVTAKYDSFVTLIGVRRIDGVEPRLETWWETTSDGTGDVAFAVTSLLVGRAKYSLIPGAGPERDMGQQPEISTKLWKAGFIYSTQVVLNHRIGIERYSGHWSTRDGSAVPQRVDRKPDTTLLVVE
jgi:hypothetical protein